MLDYDSVISFVLYHTPSDEVRLAIEQVLASVGKNHVVLIDNSVPPLNLDFTADPRITVIRSGANIGYGSGHNLALRRFAGRTRYHFVLNTDLHFGPEVIPRIVSFMDTNPEIGLAMPRVRYPNGEVQHLCRLLPRPIDIVARAFFSRQRWAQALNRRYEFQDWAYDEALSFPFLSGCFMAIRPQALSEAGLFDQRFFLFAEDLDLSRRLHRVSRTVLFPEVEVIHEYRTRSEKSWQRRMYLVRSFISYFNKYGWLIDRERTDMNRQTLHRFLHRKMRHG